MKSEQKTNKILIQTKFFQIKKVLNTKVMYFWNCKAKYNINLNKFIRNLHFQETKVKQK